MPSRETRLTPKLRGRERLCFSKTTVIILNLLELSLVMSNFMNNTGKVFFNEKISAVLM